MLLSSLNPFLFNFLFKRHINGPLNVKYGLSRNNNAVGFTHGTKITPNRTVAINVGITAQMLQIKNAPLLNLNISGINESQLSK